MMKAGQCNAFQIIARDITERKDAEDAMLNAQTQLRIAMDLAKLVHWEYDVESDVYTFDEQFYNLYGSNQEKEGGRLMTPSTYARRFLPPEEEGLVVEEIRKCVAAVEPDHVGQVTHTIIRSDGERRTINVRFGVIKDAAGRTVKVFGANQDITERMRSEEELGRSQQLLQLVMDSIPQRIIWKDRDLKYIGCNRNAAIGVGFGEPRDLVGKSDVDVVQKDSAERYQADDRLVMESGTPKINFEERLQLMDGGERWLMTTKVPLRDSRGEVIGVMGSYEDITERKKTTQAMKQAMAAMESSVDGMAILDADGRYVSSTGPTRKCMVTVRRRSLWERAGAYCTMKRGSTISTDCICHCCSVPVHGGARAPACAVMG